MNTQVLFSSKDEVWATPQDFFNKLNEEFHFTLDPCALPENAKCAKYFTPEDDGLQQDWGVGYSEYNYPYEVVGGLGFSMCIPYEGNEHLRGTTDDCDEYYKTW